MDHKQQDDIGFSAMAKINLVAFLLIAGIAPAAWAAGTEPDGMPDFIQPGFSDFAVKRPAGVFFKLPPPLASTCWCVGIATTSDPRPNLLFDDSYFKSIADVTMRS